MIFGYSLIRCLPLNSHALNRLEIARAFKPLPPPKVTVQLWWTEMQSNAEGGEGGENSVKRHLKQDFPAHWSSICCMLRRVLEQQKALLECVGKKKTAVVLSSTK